MTQKEILLNYLKGKNWLPGYKLIGVNTPSGFLGVQSGRRARELFNEGKLERKVEGRFVYYRLNKKRFKEVIYKVEGKEVARAFEER